MNIHSCLLCLGSNLDGATRLAIARRVLATIFPDIRFSEEMETEAIGSGFLSPFHNQVAKFNTFLSAQEVRSLLKQLEKDNGRLPEDKEQGIVKLDIDLLKYDDTVLKPEDLTKPYVQTGIRSLK